MLIHYGFIIVILSIMVVTGALGFARFGYSMILPFMKEGLSLTYTQMGLLATGNLIGYFIFSIIGGWFATRYSSKKVISSSLMLAGITMILTGFSKNFYQALLFRTATGIGSGGSNVPVMGLLSSWFTSRRRGMASGFAVGGSGIGLLLTGYLVPRWVSNYGPRGWRMSWIYLGAAVILIGVVAWIFLRDRPAEVGLKPIGGVPKGDEKINNPGFGELCRNKSLWHLAAIYFTFGFSYIIYATFFAAYIIKERHMHSGLAGNLLSLIGILSIVSGLMWGSISDIIGRKFGFALVSFFQGLSYLIFTLNIGASSFYISAAMFGLTAWSIPAIMAAACGDYCGAKMAPAALGFVTFIFGIGQMISPSIAGYLTDTMGSFNPAFILACLMAWLGTIISLALKKLTSLL